MNRLILSLPLLLIAVPAAAEPRPDPREVAEQQCAVSDTDLVGQRLARLCRAEVLRRERARQAASDQRDLRLAEIRPHRP